MAVGDIDDKRIEQRRNEWTAKKEEGHNDQKQ
jgi:hypothetical protein